MRSLPTWKVMHLHDAQYYDRQSKSALCMSSRQIQCRRLPILSIVLQLCNIQLYNIHHIQLRNIQCTFIEWTDPYRWLRSLSGFSARSMDTSFTSLLKS